MTITTALTAAIPTLAVLWILAALARPVRPRPSVRRCRHCGSMNCETPDLCDGTAAFDAGLHDPNSGWRALATPPTDHRGNP
jgi:hypothetical protein